MPTKKPKIILYTTKEVYDCFVKFKEKHQLSMSETGTIILAEYFGLRETIIGISGKRATEGVTLAKIQNLEARVQKLEAKVQRIEVLTPF